MKQMTQFKRQEGFTLIELMIVIAIIGILAVIAIPAYQDYSIRAKVSEAIAFGSSAKTSVTEYYLTNSALPADNAAAGLSATSTDYAGTYVEAIEVSSGTINIHFQNTGSTTLDGDYLILTPDTSVTNGLGWSCGTSDSASYQYVPSNCRSAT